MLSPRRRTLLLAALLTATLVWAAVYRFDVPAREMAWLAAYSVAGVFAIMAAAALFVALLQVAKWLAGKRR